jgi:hypothetical protein
MNESHDKVLVICYEDGRQEPVSIKDLLEGLVMDKDLAKLQPWVLEQIIESIFSYFKNDLKRESVSHTDFISLIRNLQKSFYQHTNQNQRQLNLFDVAKTCGSAFELEFFSRIREFLTSKTSPPSPYQQPPIELTGLRQCCKFLAGRQRWSKRCAEVRDEIVNYIRTEAAKCNADELSLSVIS